MRKVLCKRRLDQVLLHPVGRLLLGQELLRLLRRNLLDILLTMRGLMYQERSVVTIPARWGIFMIELLRLGQVDHLERACLIVR